MFICMIQPIFTFDKLLQRLQLGKEVTPFVIWRENDLFGATSALAGAALAQAAKLVD